jgi:predicted transport protein
MKHIQLKTLNLKRHPQLSEKWLHDVIAEDPSILGIGEVVVKDRERIHPGAGRLDMLLQDVDGHNRYEVEIQLGSSDESHIIRTLEYWDIERRRYPQYDHTAIIIAEDITSRFLNVVSLFNGFIPIMALQLTAIETPDGVGLQFTRVLDTVRLGYLDEDEETAENTDRNFWETKRGTIDTVKLADSIFEIIRDFAPNADANFNKQYIGILLGGKPLNFATCRPQKKGMRLNLRMPQTEEADEQLDARGIDVLDYDKKWGSYRLKLDAQAIAEHKDFLRELLEMAYSLRK